MTSTEKWLLARAVIAFLALPGIVAFLIPSLLVSRQPSRVLNPIGLALVVPGTLLLLWCVRDFYARGRGTLAPWDPPQSLVVSGPYQYSRNPMYVAVTLILWGCALSVWSLSLAVYAGVVMIAFHLRVVLGEEPWLARTHGAQWAEYKSQVPRWLRMPRKTARHR